MPTVFVRAPWFFALRMSRMQRDVWCRLRRDAFLTLKRIWLENLVKACMNHLSSSGMVHHGGHRVVECGLVASEIGGMVGLLVYITQNSGLSACFPMVIVSFSCLWKEVTTNLAAASARSLPRMLVWPLILFSFVRRPRLAL